ncbi:histidine N-acetyltransferase-like [Rhincodon typus]|uniref:histidine N-acetyltransferase-like n=1 Tax=Rhincodon typus TaxID=259920 RepID=UPI00202EF1CC|nr:histidine N-acetyltransferase-like [Rhincodon typus]XP_048476138.1 histidine N-acetyltransferase-like [Rhincodon typus]XP_048476139.1 histidine N-acetyltransferase-like [Rhincodon typus]
MAVDGHTLEFCLAEEADFEEVMSISGDVYGGIDYLPVRYHAWIRDPFRRVILAKKKGQIVALVSANIVDNGHTAVFEGLRVAPLERGKGIAGLIQGYCLNLVKDQFPEVKVHRYTKSGQLAPKILTKFRLICKQEVLSVQFKAEDIRPKLEAAVAQLKESGKEWEDPVLLGASDAKRVFLSPRVVDGVLPGKTIIQDWVPYRPLESNLKKLVSQDFIWMADDKEEPTVLSVGTAPYRVPLGTGYHRLNIDIFGKQFPRARNQLLAQLQQGVSTLEVPIYCLLYFEPSMWQDMLSFCQTALGLHKDRDFEGQNLLEADM